MTITTHRILRLLPVRFTPLLAAILPLSFAASPAAAQEIPRYDPPRWCHRVASSGGSRSEMIYGGCMEQEQSAYDALKGEWPQLPAQMRRWCDKVARAGGGGSYVILQGCVEQERAAKSGAGKPFKF